jgi:hypothetical protein
MSNKRFQQALEKIDAANAKDPNLIDVNGQKRPLEVVHAERRTEWIRQLVGGSASEALFLAARAQHIRRWAIPRDTYPRDRLGYLKWRTDLKKFHAQKTAEILAEVGYNDEMIERVKDLIMKKRLKQDPEVQALEDTLCLVFLEQQFSEFAQKESDKIVDIVRKTWRKMSPAGQQLALQLPLADEDRAIIEQALSH